MPLCNTVIIGRDPPSVITCQDSRDAFWLRTSRMSEVSKVYCCPFFYSFDETQCAMVPFHQMCLLRDNRIPRENVFFKIRSIWLPRQTSSPSSNIDKREETSREEKNNGIREKQSLLNMPLPRGWILNLMEGDHTFRVTFFRPSSTM